MAFGRSFPPSEHLAAIQAGEKPERQRADCGPGCAALRRALQHVESVAWISEWKALVYFGLLFLSVLCLSTFAQEQQVVVPYTLADRDRAILTEAKIRALDVRFESIDKQFMDQQKQIDELKTLFYWGFAFYNPGHFHARLHNMGSPYCYEASLRTSSEGRRK